MKSILLFSWTPDIAKLLFKYMCTCIAVSVWVKKSVQYSLETLTGLRSRRRRLKRPQRRRRAPSLLRRGRTQLRRRASTRPLGTGGTTTATTRAASETEMVRYIIELIKTSLFVEPFAMVGVLSTSKGPPFAYVSIPSYWPLWTITL